MKYGILIYNHDFMSLREFFIFKVEYNERMSLEEYFNLIINKFKKELELDYKEFTGNSNISISNIKFNFETDNAEIDINNFWFVWKVRLVFID